MCEFPQLVQKIKVGVGKRYLVGTNAAEDSSVYDSLGCFFYEIASIYYYQEMQRQKSASNNHIPQPPPKTKQNWSCHAFPHRIFSN